MRPHIAKPLLLAGLVMASFMAQAAAAGTPADYLESATIYGSARMTFSKPFINAVNASGMTVIGHEPATLETTRRPPGLYNSITWTSPLKEGHFSIEASWDSVKQLHTTYQGSVRFSVTDDGFTTTGGTLVLSNLNVDLRDSVVYGDVTGDNGVGLSRHVALWRFASVSGDVEPDLPGGVRTQQITLSGLSMEDAMSQYFAQALGLTDAGIAAFGQAWDLGTMDLEQTIAFPLSPTPGYKGNVNITVVPEPGTLAFFTVGLGMLAMTARHRKTAPSRAA